MNTFDATSRSASNRSRSTYGAGLPLIRRPRRRAGAAVPLEELRQLEHLFCRNVLEGYYVVCLITSSELDFVTTYFVDRLFAS